MKIELTRKSTQTVQTNTRPPSWISFTWPFDSIRMCRFLLVVHWNQPYVSNASWDICIQLYQGHDLDLVVSRDVIGRVTVWYPGVIFYRFLIVTESGSPVVFKIRGSKHTGVTTLTFHSHVTSSITWPFNSPYVISYWLSIGTDSNKRTKEPNQPTN